MEEKIKILIVDDHSLIREGLKQLLELDGDIKVVGEAGNGEECLKMLDTVQADVVLLDIDGNECKTGDVGEICIRTENGAPNGLFIGYYLDEEKTKDVWYDGYYHTGDQATMDEDGYLWYVGRIDDVINSSGYRIGPFEIESVIMELPYVLECAITGVPDETRGQIVKATVVLTKDKQPSEELVKEIQNYVKTHTAPYKYPRKVEFVENLPKTISGKIRRKVLRDNDNAKN